MTMVTLQSAPPDLGCFLMGFVIGLLLATGIIYGFFL